MPTQSKPSKKILRDTLLESLFDPKEPGIMQPILELGDTTYYRQRAVEMILQTLNPSCGPQLRNQHLKVAISLLLMARVNLKPELGPKQISDVSPAIKLMRVCPAGNKKHDWHPCSPGKEACHACGTVIEFMSGIVWPPGSSESIGTIPRTKSICPVSGKKHKKNKERCEYCRMEAYSGPTENQMPG